MADHDSRTKRHGQNARKKHKKYMKPGSDSSSDGEPEWVEAKAKPRSSAEGIETKAVQLQREDWMSMVSNFGPTVSRKDLHKPNKNESEAKQSDRLQLDNPGQHERELNPYWRDGGKGVPDDEVSSRKSRDSSHAVSAVGDGGVKWLRRAYQRAQEQAKEEGRSLEDVAAERWGSLEKLERLLKSAEEKSNQGRSSRDDDRSSYNTRYHDKQNDSRHRRTNERSTRSREENSREARYEKNYENDRKSGRRTNEISHRREETGRKNPAWKIKSSEDNESRVGTYESRSKDGSESNESNKSEKNSELPMAPTHAENKIEVQQSQSSTKLAEMDLNQLSARLLKAELMGNESLIKELRERVENLRKNCQKPVDEVVIVRGSGKPRENKRKKYETHDTDGKRQNYFADDAKYSLNKIFEKEKSRTTHDENLLFATLMSKSQGNEEDDDIYMGEGSKDKDISSQAARELKKSAALDHCQYCFDSKKFSKYLMVAMATKVYLSVPRHVSLTEGHCFIVPMQHVIASTQIDEDVWEEVQYFKKALTRMFEATNEDVVFYEMSRNLNYCPHMIIECVPLPRDVGDTAPIYFKKAIMECETEWSLNKKVVDLTKDVRKAVPKGLPYFAVNFGTEGGFAHVIEDERLFPKNFAQEIIGGMLDLEPHMWRKPSIQSFDQQQDKTFSFIRRWKSFDWTTDK